MTAGDLARLNEADRLIQSIVREFGLDVMPQEFDVVPAQKMLEIMAYRLPVNFSHWSFGRDYEAERTKYEHGYAVPYEVVFNSDPSRAYLMDTNPFCIQVLVMAHVYAHNDFMKNSRWFRNSRRDMISSASEAAARFRKYEEDYGLEAVERMIDSGMAIQWNIDPDRDTHPETEENARERLYGWSRRPEEERTLFDDLLPAPAQVSQEDKRKLRRRTPPEPTIDLLGYLLSHSPKPLKEWERDVLSTIQLQAQYFVSYRRTKIMNEGWATFWHEKIMQRLFAEKFLTPEEHGFYNLYNARVKAHHPRSLNPYLLGCAIFADIEERWDRGRFGPAWEECEDARRKAAWDTGAKQGRQKIFEVRRTHMDWFFVHEFLSKEVIDNLNLYIYREQEKDTHYESVVEENDWRLVKAMLVQALMNWGVPRIEVVDGNYLGIQQLYLRHAFEGLPLDDEYARKTLEHLYSLWDRPIYLETQEPHNGHTRTRLYTVDEEGIRIRVK